MRVSLSHVLKEIETKIDSSQRLSTTVTKLGIPRIQIEIIAELVFLRVFIAWEDFLEESFVRYLVGARSLSGFCPTRFVKAKDMNHAINLIYSGRKYFPWNSASAVIQISESCFRDGEPYKNVLQGATAELNHMNTIRHIIAHKSTFSKNRFKEFLRRKLGHGRRGMTPGRFLLAPLHSFPQTTFLDYYVGIIKTASKIIVQ